MTRENNKKDLDDFYQEIDRDKFKTLFSPGLIIVILLLLYGVIIYSFFIIKSNYWPKIKSNDQSASYEINDLSISSLLNKKIISKSPKESFEIKITEEELSDSIGLENENFPMRKATLDIIKAGLMIRGKISDSLLSFYAEIKLSPFIDDDKCVQFEIVEANAGFVSLPKATKEEIDGYISSSVNEDLRQFKKAKFDSVECFDGYILLKGVLEE